MMLEEFHSASLLFKSVIRTGTVFLPEINTGRDACEESQLSQA